MVTPPLRGAFPATVLFHSKWLQLRKIPDTNLGFLLDASVWWLTLSLMRRM